MNNEQKESIWLKWRTLKSWEFHSEQAEKLLREYNEIGSELSAMMQHDTPRQKEIICELIEIGNFETVYLDWDGIEVSKDKAKEYVINYGQTPTVKTP